MTEPSNSFQHEAPERFQPFEDVPPQPPKHSGLGIASFIIGLASILIFIVCIIITTAFIMNHTSLQGNSVPTVDDIEGFGTLVIAGTVMIGSVALAFVGLILGIVAVCLRNRRKVFSIIGLVLNAVLVVGLSALVLIGLLIGSQSV